MIIAGILLLIIVYSMVRSYNKIVIRRNQVQNAMGGTDAILKKRHDLIPNLVSAVKQYMNFESETLSRITELRTSLVSERPESPARLEHENQLSALLGKVMVAVENYPDLKSNTNMLHLQQSLTDIEEQLSAARRSYNASVMAYNNTIGTLPSNIIAGMMGATVKPYFEISQKEADNVSVKQLFDGQ